MGDFLSGGRGNRQKSSITGAQNFNLESLLSFLGTQLQGAPDLFQAFQPSAGRLAPPLTSTQQLSLTGLENLASGQSEPAQGPSEQAGGQALTQILGRQPGGPEFEQFFQQSVVAPTLRALEQEDILSSRLGAGSGTIFGTDQATREADSRERAFQQIASQSLEAAQVNEAQRLQAAGLAQQQRTPQDLILDEIRALSDQAALSELEREAEREQTGAERQEFLRLNEGNLGLLLDLLLQASTTPTIGGTGAPGPRQPGFIEGLLNSFFSRR